VARKTKRVAQPWFIGLPPTFAASLLTVKDGGEDQPANCYFFCQICVTLNSKNKKQIKKNWR